MNYLLIYANADENGDFTEVYLGARIIPNKQYDYFFFSMDESIINDYLDDSIDFRTTYKVDTSTKTLIKK